MLRTGQRPNGYVDPYPHDDFEHASWSEVWEHVKATLPGWRAESGLGALQADGGRLLRLRSHGAPDLAHKIVYLDADGSFVDVAKDDSMGGWWPGNVTLADGRVVRWGGP